MPERHQRSGERRRGRLIAVARLGWAAALLVAPGRVLRSVGATMDHRSRATARILGARHLLQAAVELRSWPRWRGAGAAVDAAHAATAAALAVTDRRRRRVAAADTAVASTFALLGLRRPPNTTQTTDGV